MTRERLRPILIALATIVVAGGSALVRMHAADSERPPNFVIILLDDSGWNDFEPFGEPRYATPNVARLAQDGCRFDNFYVPSPICSASRAALLSGCYPGRTRVYGSHGPNGLGLEPKFATLGEVLKKRGYATAAIGKWHIGDQPATRPWARGFDETSGLMYSNDMWEHHPTKPKRYSKQPLQFWENGKVTIERVTHEDQRTLTTRYTTHAVEFIERHREEPFFLYLAHSMPHVPIHASEKFEGKSEAGLYADVMMELDASVGEVVKALEKAKVDDRTLVIFTSDNGPWTKYGNHGGKTPFREAKATSFDGGIRSACIMKFPGKIAPGTVSSRTLFTIDLLPTLAYLAGAELPDNPIDGKNVWPLIRGDRDATNPHDYYAFGMGFKVDGVISADGRFKLHLPHGYPALVEAGQDGLPGKTTRKQIGLSLFDLDKDPAETTDVREEHPEVAARLKKFAEAHRKRFY